VTGSDRRAFATNDKESVEFTAVESGIFHVVAGAKGFSNWTSRHRAYSGKAVTVTGCQLKVAEAKTTFYVGYTSEHIANEQVKIEEKQRVVARGILSESTASLLPQR